MKFKESNSTQDFTFISKPGVYKARLAAVRKSLQDEKYAKDKDGNPVDPKELVSFVFDVEDKNGNNVHVQTKPCSITFSDKSKLPVFFENVVALNSMEDFYKLLWDENDSLKDFFCDVMVKVTTKDEKVFNEVTQIVEATNDNGVKASDLCDWDLKVYGKPCTEYDLAPSYDKK